MNSCYSSLSGGKKALPKSSMHHQSRNSIAEDFWRQRVDEADASIDFYSAARHTEGIFFRQRSVRKINM